MPVLDHFRPPLSAERHWQAFHAGWASALAGRLNESILPPGYFAEEYVQLGPRVEIDLATYEEAASESSAAAGGGSGVQLARGLRTWAPTEATWTIPAVLPDTVEVRVFSSEAGPQLVGVVELVSPSNKDRPAHRRAFATKSASYLGQGVSLVVVDVVTSRAANLHNELMDLLRVQPKTAYRLATEPPLYVVAYRPIVRREGPQIDLWPTSLAIGDPLPEVPLYLRADLAVPIELEASYVETCRRHRIAVREG